MSAPPAAASPLHPATSEAARAEPAWLAWAAIAACVAATALFVASPAAYSTLSQEGGIIETLSAWMFFAAAGMLAVTARRLHRAGERGYAALMAAGAFLLFMSGGEEVSWFQRVLAIETPAAFAGNLQGETNLHNFETNAIEVAYYLGVWAVLVVLRFAYDHLPVLREVPLLTRFTPGRAMLAMAAPTVAFNHEMWNQVLIQVSVWVTVLILLRYIRITEERERTLMAGSLAALVAIQLAYFAYGGRLVRYWETSEYREFFMAALLLAACVQVLRSVGGRRARARAVAG